ncbi:MAG: hypothetical protein HOG89_00575 [Candidatus Peribacter sp.]|jgi:hypothetical protein|nr:hypothetical protein [Candidatus Peribacter sp.]MBT4392980.1 hypothetical protein [Candidatus Peribacter sp.]MBT4601040.1 hypothetical protein [Candidatus Peribacter sp.]MBT5149598.1 hypothetical protein [Candidatus Peribacter sp.]MBT5637472.1 hypothetical protein [Candidatus Peribacter sp.]
MKLGSSKAWAKTLGSGLAQVQHATDKLVVFGFKSLKKAGKTPNKDKTKNKYIKSAKTAGRTTLSFLGTLGDSFYNEYEELKKQE